MREKKCQKQKKVQEQQVNFKNVKCTFIAWGLRVPKCVSRSHFVSFATIVTTVEDRKTECNKIRNGVIRRIKMPRDNFYCLFKTTYPFT